MTDEDLQKEFNRLSSEEYTENDIKATLNKESYVDSLTEHGPLSKTEVKDSIKNLYDMLKDKDRFKLDKKYLAVIIGTLIYVISPIDLVPDVIPVLGLLDDAAIIAAATGAISNIIIKYKEWKKEQTKNTIEKH